MRWDNLQNPHKFCSIKSGARFEYMNGKLLLLGGSQNKKETNDLFTYDIGNKITKTFSLYFSRKRDLGHDSN